MTGSNSVVTLLPSAAPAVERTGFMANEPPQATALRQWAESKGARFHPALYFRQDADGMSVHTRSDIGSETPVISAPFALAITPAVALTALRQILGETTDLCSLTERELVCTYIAIHWISKEVGLEAEHLQHAPYVDSLPARTQLRTPLHFTPVELELLRGTNMASATTEREAAWRSEWERCRAAIGRWNEQFTWEHYLTASTHLSARAFPSTLLSTTPSLVATPSSHPILLPVIDSLNHARAHPVSWSVSTDESGGHTLSIIQHARIAAGEEVFNNYGPKPNAELVLGYGFALKTNPDDTLVLKLAGAGDRREIGRNGLGMDRVFADVRAALVAQTGEEPVHEHEDIVLEYDAAFMLTDMLEQRLAGTPDLAVFSEESPPQGVRTEVLRMLKFYVQGQREILQDAIGWSKDELGQVMRRAAELGIDLGDEEDEDSV